MEPRIAYFIRITEEGEKSVTPCIAKRGVKGYFETDWKWDITENFTFKDAEESCARMNRQMNVCAEEAISIVLGSF